MNTENHQNDGRNLPIDYRAIIDHYYGEGESELKSLLLTHSRDVANKALSICDKHPEFCLDRDFVEAAAMLHDLGIIGSGGTLDPSESREMIAPESSVNFSQVTDTTLADLVDKGNAELTFEARKPVFDEYQVVMREQSPIAYLYTYDSLTAYNKRVTGLNVDDFNTLNWSSWKWDIEG